MKRTVKALIAVYFTVFMCVFGGISAFAWDVDTRSQDIVLKNVPEGTAFADILVKDKKNDKYAACFNEENGRLLGVGKDCGLAGYEEDGYTSMLLRHNCAVFEKADLSEHSSVSFKLNEENNKLFNHFRRIKVACCDKDGNILGVTDVSGFDLLQNRSKRQQSVLRSKYRTALFHDGSGACGVYTVCGDRNCGDHN